MLRCLVVTASGRAERCFNGSRIVVGREPECDLALPEILDLSRRHCALTLAAGVLSVEDLGSRHGTFVDGLRVGRAEVPVGATLRAGSVRITVLAIVGDSTPSRGAAGAERTATMPAALVSLPADGDGASGAQEPALPGFTFRRVLGRGGMGVVWLAHREDGAEVAVKCLHEGLAASAAARADFLHELMLLSRVQHSGVVRYLDHGMVGAVPFAVMEYVPGGSLREELSRRGALPATEVVDIATEVVRVLQHVHVTHGMVHGDVKPANLLRAVGGVRLCDFGLSRLATSRNTDLKASAAYCPPELFREGMARSVASDLYSLGITLFQLATGRLPFPQLDTRALAEAHASEPLPWSCQDCASIPEGLRVLIERLAAKSASHRPRTHDEVLADLALLAP